MFPDVPMHGMLRDGDALESLNQDKGHALTDWLTNLMSALHRVHGHLRRQEQAHQLDAEGHGEYQVQTMAKIASEGLVGCFMSVKDLVADELKLPAVPQAQCRRDQRSSSSADSPCPWPSRLDESLSPDCGEGLADTDVATSRRSSPPELMLEGHHQHGSHVPHFLAPVSPTSKVVPESPKHRLPERRFVRSTIKAGSQPGSPTASNSGRAATDSTGTEGTARAGEASRSSPASMQLPASEVLLAEASAKLLGRGWSPAAVAEIFGIEDELLTLCLSQRPAADSSHC